MSDKIITFKNISKTYKDGKYNRKVLKNINGDIDKGSVNVILGESGCGKTTFLSILSGIERPDCGEVIYNGKNIYSMRSDYGAKVRGRSFGIVFQDFNLIDELTLKDNILLPLKINKKPFDKDHYYELINRMKLKTVENNFPNELSGGEKQRTAIARAMIIKPDIVFADEPTGNLDNKNSEDVAEIFSDMNKMYGTTIIVVTHNKNLFANPDKVFSIYEGSLLNIPC